ncbi:MAG: hypothetical protein KAH96_06540 [Alphaproteobacteria bacterium]|nr:hypothetical protein [Alphaproteobacteria bacterium]
MSLPYDLERKAEIALNTAKTGVTTEISNVVEDTTPQLGGTFDSNSKQVRFSKGSDVASANALTLGDDGNYFDITGVTAITSIVAKAIGTVVKLHFDGILTLTHHATDLILPSGANITTAAGDELEFIEYAAGDWRCTGYVLASGCTVLNMAPSVDHTGNGTIGYVTVDVNAYGIGAALYIAADGHYEEADADAAATMPCVAIALEAGTGTKKVLFFGVMRNDTWTFTPGGAVYVSTTAGTFSTTAPTGTGKQVQKAGTAITADILLFNPSPDLIELA